jgi:hypothetical protein
MAPLDDWYHCMGNTYGTWLPGSPKGFRTRHHREHVEGDYKNPPPPGKYEQRFRKAQELMSRAPVYLSMEQRKRALEEFVKSLTSRGIDLEAMAIGRIHFHLLGRFRDRNPRRWLGLAKKESSHYCKETGHTPQGGLWAVRTECKPVKGLGHFHETVGYILDHEQEGAAVWLRSPEPPDLIFGFALIDLLIE